MAAEAKAEMKVVKGALNDAKEALKTQREDSGEIIMLQRRIDELVSKSLKFEEACKINNAQKKALEKTVTDLHADAETAKATVDSFQTRFDEKSRELLNLQTQIGQLTIKLESESKLVAEKDSVIEAKAEMLKRKCKEIEVLQNELVSLKEAQRHEKQNFAEVKRDLEDNVARCNKKEVRT